MSLNKAKRHSCVTLISQHQPSGPSTHTAMHPHTLLQTDVLSTLRHRLSVYTVTTRPPSLPNVVYTVTTRPPSLPNVVYTVTTRPPSLPNVVYTVTTRPPSLPNVVYTVTIDYPPFQTLSTLSQLAHPPFQTLSTLSLSTTLPSKRCLHCHNSPTLPSKRCLHCHYRLPSLPKVLYTVSTPPPLSSKHVYIVTTCLLPLSKACLHCPYPPPSLPKANASLLCIDIVFVPVCLPCFSQHRCVCAFVHLSSIPDSWRWEMFRHTHSDQIMSVYSQCLHTHTHTHTHTVTRTQRPDDVSLQLAGPCCWSVHGETARADHSKPGCTVQTDAAGHAAYIKHYTQCNRFHTTFR